jgi:hypothetical protein
LTEFSPLSVFGYVTQWRENVAAGADLVWFSRDKLLGGPQCGNSFRQERRYPKQPDKRTARPRPSAPDKLSLAAPGWKPRFASTKSGRQLERKARRFRRIASIRWSCNPRQPAAVFFRPRLRALNPALEVDHRLVEIPKSARASASPQTLPPSWRSRRTCAPDKSRTADRHKQNGEPAEFFCRFFYLFFFKFFKFNINKYISSVSKKLKKTTKNKTLINTETEGSNTSAISLADNTTGKRYVLVDLDSGFGLRLNDLGTHCPVSVISLLLFFCSRDCG